MITDEPVECPRCGVRTSVVDIFVRGDPAAKTDEPSAVLRLCVVCAKKPLGPVLIEFRRMVKAISDACEQHCTMCGGTGWTATRMGSGTRVVSCEKCSETGVNVPGLLDALEVAAKERPMRCEEDKIKKTPTKFASIEPIEPIEEEPMEATIEEIVKDLRTEARVEKRKCGRPKKPTRKQAKREAEAEVISIAKPYIAKPRKRYRTNKAK